MFTDIVGYTALMGKDEQKPFELSIKNTEIQKPIKTREPQNLGFPNVLYFFPSL